MSMSMYSSKKIKYDEVLGTKDDINAFVILEKCIGNMLRSK